jgi:hypothetical protein
LQGISWNISGQLKLLEEFTFSQEILDIPQEKQRPLEFYLALQRYLWVETASFARRTPCGQAVDFVPPSLAGRTCGKRVECSYLAYHPFSTLIHRLPTLRRGEPATGC